MSDSANGRQRSGPIGNDGRNAVPLPADVHTPEEWDTYFNSVAQGIGLDLAARAIGSTGSRIKRLIGRDPEYGERMRDAQMEAGDSYRDRLRATARIEALGSEGKPPNPRLLEVELATHVPGYEHLRRDRIRHEGRIEHALVLDASKLDALDAEELARLESVFEKLAVEEQRALPPGPQ